MDWRQAETEFESEVLGETTLPRMFEASADRNAESPAQRYKGGIYDRSLAGPVVPAAPDGEYASLSYNEMRRSVRRLAAGFRDLGVGAGDRVGIFADTRMEWAQADFGLLAAGGVVTTVYTGSSPDQVEYLLCSPRRRARAAGSSRARSVARRATADGTGTFRLYTSRGKALAAKSPSGSYCRTQVREQAFRPSGTKRRKKPRNRHRTVALLVSDSIRPGRATKGRRARR